MDVLAPARRFFELRKARRADLGSAGPWHRWSEELDFHGGAKDGVEGYGVSLFLPVCRALSHSLYDTIALYARSPTLYIPHLLRVLGPSLLTHVPPISNCLTPLSSPRLLQWERRR